MSKSKEKNYKKIIFDVLSFPLGFAGMIADGYIVSVLWEWLIVPVFGVQELTVSAAMGLILVLTLVKSGGTNNILNMYLDKKAKKEQDIVEATKLRVLIVVAKFVFFLPVGYAISLFI